MASGASLRFVLVGVVVVGEEVEKEVGVVDVTQIDALSSAGLRRFSKTGMVEFEEDGDVSTFSMLAGKFLAPATT
jgi:hypothetical protein